MKAWFSTLLATIVAGVIVYWFTDGFSHWWPRPKMGPLLSGVGLGHDDIDAGKWVSLASAEACSDLCYERDDCKAMTYVVSNRSCWLKYAVPNRTSNPDEVSAIKQ